MQYRVLQMSHLVIVLEGSVEVRTQISSLDSLVSDTTGILRSAQNDIAKLNLSTDGEPLEKDIEFNWLIIK
ncbi:MAG: hypothetical protein Q7S18_03165 [bacterium]|nr:hypothetical protein [bacterium]